MALCIHEMKLYVPVLFEYGDDNLFFSVFPPVSLEAQNSFKNAGEWPVLQSMNVFCFLSCILGVF